MGFVTNRWQPVNASPGPTPVPTWERIKNGVTATTAFDYSSYNYTEYLILVYSSSSYFQFFFLPSFQSLRNGNATQYVAISHTAPRITFNIRQKTTNKTSSYKYTVYGRNKASWSLVSDTSALPNYTELVTGNGYYTPFKYQDSDMRTAGGSLWISSTNVTYSDYRERIYNNAYTLSTGDGRVWTRLSSNEASWTHINSTTSPVSIADISYSEMFIIGKSLFSTGALNREYQALYVFPDMLKGNFPAGGYTSYSSSSNYTGSWGDLTVSDSSVSAEYFSKNGTGAITRLFQSIDIYYR